MKSHAESTRTALPGIGDPPRRGGRRSGPGLGRPLAAGEPVLESALFEAGAEGGLAAVIAPNRRAVSVKVDSVIGVAGFVKPGARVDILATLRRIDAQKPIPFSKVILQDVRVLAADQKLAEER